MNSQVEEAVANMTGKSMTRQQHAEAVRLVFPNAVCAEREHGRDVQGVECNTFTVISDGVLLHEANTCRSADDAWRVAFEAVSAVDVVCDPMVDPPLSRMARRVVPRLVIAVGAMLAGSHAIATPKHSNLHQMVVGHYAVRRFG